MVAEASSIVEPAAISEGGDHAEASSHSETAEQSMPPRETLSAVLKALVSGAPVSPDQGMELGLQPDPAMALWGLGDSPAGDERFWAAITLLFGIPGDRGVAQDAARAEALLTEALASEETLRQCPNCAALWAFGRRWGAFSPAPAGSPIAQFAQMHGVSKSTAAVILAAQHGSALGRLLWGELKAGGAIAQQDAAAQEQPERWAAQLRPPWTPEAGDKWRAAVLNSDSGAAGQATAAGSCGEALQAVMLVSSEAMTHEATTIPQPVDLDYLARTRRENKEQYALATQLADDGYAEGLAAKAEMLFYGREQVVPQRWELRGFPRLRVAPLLLAATITVVALPRRWLSACRRRGHRQGDVAAQERTEVGSSSQAVAAVTSIAAGSPGEPPSLRGHLRHELPRGAAAPSAGVASATSCCCSALAFILRGIALIFVVNLLGIVLYSDDGGIGDDGFHIGDAGVSLTDSLGSQPASGLLGTHPLSSLDLAAPSVSLGSPTVTSLGALPSDPDQAHELFEEAALGGHWGAAYALAMIELDGENRSRATPWLEMVVAEGDDRARAFSQHFQHKFGLGREKDPGLAGIFLQEAADLGEPNAAVLFAEAHGYEGAQPDVEPLGGRNLTVALEYYRRAATLGQSTCRYNVGVLLLRLVGGDLEKLPLSTCWEARAEFVEVATDLDPTFRLLFALALRAWELGDSVAALGLFMLLSEAGGAKAHRNAATLWEDDMLTHASAATFLDDSTSMEPQERCEDTTTTSPKVPSTSPQKSQAGEVRFTRIHTGVFCCPGGVCDNDRRGDCDCKWLLNEGAVDPEKCLLLCSEEPACRFATLYTSGFCQLSAECEHTFAAGDESAQTYDLQRLPSTTSPAPREPAEVASECMAALRASKMGLQCWPFSGSVSDPSARRCAAVFHARAASVGAQPDAPKGSAMALGAGAAEVAALAAARHLEQMESFGEAQAWACAAAQRFRSDHGQLLCARLEAEAWDGHPRNLDLALRELRSIVDTHSTNMWIAANGATMWLAWSFSLAILRGCHLSLADGGALCPDFAATASSWGAPAGTSEWQHSLERTLDAAAISVLVAAMAASARLLQAAASLCPQGQRQAEQSTAVSQ